MEHTPLSTAHVPTQFLGAAFLVGKVPFRVSRSHPSALYTLYIPPHAYNPDPSRRNNESNSESNADQNPVYNLPRLPLMIDVHGTGRNAGSCRDRLIDFADTHHVAILAPLFPASIEGPADLDSYKLLRSTMLASDLVLLDILDEIKAIWPGIATDKVFLLGFSGGGQFALRFLYVHPERLWSVSIGAPGRVTFLDGRQDWPDGVKDFEAVFGPGATTGAEKIKAIKAIQLVVGSEDNVIHGGGEFWKWMGQLKTQLTKDESGRQSLQGPKSQYQTIREGRLDTLTKLRDSWAAEGIPARFDVVPGVGHETNKVLPAMLEFLQPHIQSFREK